MILRDYSSIILRQPFKMSFCSDCQYIKNITTILKTVETVEKSQKKLEKQRKMINVEKYRNKNDENAKK